MSRLQLPPGEPPADAVEWLREQRAALAGYEQEARQSLKDCRIALAMARHLTQESEPGVQVFAATVELELAIDRVEKIRRERARLARDARELGISS